MFVSKFVLRVNTNIYITYYTKKHMESKNINYLVMAFVFLILGAALIGQVATNTNERTSKTNVYDETFDLEALGCINATGGGMVNFTADADCNVTLANAPSSWKTTDCPVASVVVENTTAGTYTALTEGTDYDLFASTGIIHFLNTAATDAGDFNTTYVSYNYCADEYLNSSWGRTVLNLVAGFFALALLGVVLWLFYGVFRSTGLIK